MKKVLLDTDIGSDIDDVLALVYLLNQPDCELMGITTVTGEPEKRAKIARYLVCQAKKDIPIISGMSEPWLIVQHQPIAEQAKAIEHWNSPSVRSKINAVDFLRQTIHENPHEITLLAIGPLTNIALLFLLDPEIPALLESLVLMCGSFFGNTLENIKVEWNALCDPHAAAIVYRTPVKKHYSIGLDVTQKVTLQAEKFREVFSQDRLSHVLDFANIWLDKESVVTFHDPLAASMIFDPAMIRFQKGVVRVDTCGKRASGITDFIPDIDGPHEIAVEVNPDQFFSHYFSVFTQ